MLTSFCFSRFSRANPPLKFGRGGNRFLKPSIYEIDDFYSQLPFNFRTYGSGFSILVLGFQMGKLPFVIASRYVKGKHADLHIIPHTLPSSPPRFHTRPFNAFSRSPSRPRSFP